MKNIKKHQSSSSSGLDRMQNAANEQMQKMIDEPNNKEEKKPEPKQVPPAKKDIPVKKEKEENVQYRRYEPIFDMSNPNLKRIERKQRAKNGEREKKGATISFYMYDEEWEMLDNLSKKHNMTRSEYIRTLIINSI